MFLTEKPRSKPDFDKFPAAQLFLLALIRVSEPIALTSIFPYSWKLVLHFNVGDPSDASFYAGILISAFALAEAVTGMFWGAYSDRIGRKPVLLMGCAGTVASLLIVGFSNNFWLALFGRALGGFLNGNIGVIQTMVSEVTVNPKHEPKAFSVMPFVWSIGTIVGPSIGGFFANPTETYPQIFDAKGIFGTFPFLLPNLICAGLMVASIIAGWLLLHETHPDMQPWSSASATNPQTTLYASQTASHTADVVEEVSYGTFESHQPISEHETLSTNAVESSKVFSRPVVMLLVALGIFTYHSMTYDHLLPIFLQDERPQHLLGNGPALLRGGLDLTIQQVGTIMSVNGVIALIVQAVAFPILASLFGIWKLFLLVTLLHPIAYFIVPYLTLLPAHLVYPGIYTCLAIRNLLSIVAYPLLLILVKDASPSHSCLGKINGAAASTGAACRTMASPIAGLLYSIGTRTGCSAVPWFASAFVAGIGALQALVVLRHSRRKSEITRGRVEAEGATVTKTPTVSVSAVPVDDTECDCPGTQAESERQPLLSRIHV